MPQFSDDLYLGTAQTFMGTGYNPVQSVFTGSISTTTLTVTALLSGDPIQVGQWVAGANIATPTYITAFGTGSGGLGTYTVANSQTAASATITASGNSAIFDPTNMDLGVGPLGRIYVWDVVPEAKATNNVSAAATYAGAASATLAASGNTKAVVRADGTSVVQLDCPRGVSITIGTGTITNRNVTISGFDYYGQSMSEVIATGTTQSTTVNGKKAFYQISSATVSGAVGGTVAIGTSDVLGCPIRFIDRGYLDNVGWNNVLAEDASTTVVADQTNPATSSTGDVRGTLTPSSAPDGTKRLVVGIFVSGIAVGPNSTRLGALGVTQA